MNDKVYRYILYIITLVILATIGIQLYWNYKNYTANKQQLIRDVQVSLDKAVDDYYANLAKKSTIGFSFDSKKDLNFFKEDSTFTKFIKSIDNQNGKFKTIDSIDVSKIKEVKIFKGHQADSMMAEFHKPHQSSSQGSFLEELKTSNILKDSLNRNTIKLLSSKIFISLNNDSLDVRAVNKLLIEDLKRKGLGLDHHLAFYNSVPDPNSKLSKLKAKIKLNDGFTEEEYNIYVTSKSTFLPEGSLLKLGFANETQNILKRSLIGILISTLLVLSVIGCLFYLLKIIKSQKQLAEVKNDIISNITHEFKTPIATIGVALESINNFNAIEDKEKTKTYINMSSEQLEKLNIMVEKLLETATLDSNNLELNKESVDIVALLIGLTNRYKIQFTEKDFNASFKVESLIADVDVFHFENALNNILDNAVKYGGAIISIDLVPKEKGFTILISDNGNTLSKLNKERIFEKFYRVPKGNTHDVKGFGIGLYYTKTVIEKHKGAVDLELNENLTTFKMTLPNGR